MNLSNISLRSVVTVVSITLTAILCIANSAYSAGFSNRYELSNNTLPTGVGIVDITVDSRPPRYPETFINDIDGDGIPEFVAFPGGFAAGQCRPLLIALSTVRSTANIDSSNNRYIKITDANGTVPDDSFCTDIETFETVGDMNGDGFADFALYSQGTHVLQGLQNVSGEIRLADLDGSNGFVVRGALLRRDVGDLDADGLDELALTQFEQQRFDLGPEYILRGRAGPRSRTILPEADTSDEFLATIYSGQQNYGLVLPLGDVNGDAIDDLLVQQSDNLNIIYGGVDLQISRDILADPTTPAIGETCGFFSCSVLTGFDFDADGFNDIAMTFGDNSSYPSAIVYGGPDGLPEGKQLTDFTANQVTLLTGSPRLSSGFTDTFADINGDGADDVYFSSGRDTVVLFATPLRRLAEINIDSLDGSNGFILAADQVQTSSTFRPFINGRVLMADLNGDGLDDYLDGQILVAGMNDAPIGRAPLGILVRQGPESADLFWQVLNDEQDVNGFRISIGDEVLADLPASASQYRVDVASREQSQDVRVSTVDANGNELGASIRRLQPFGVDLNMVAEVYGPNLVEIIWDPPADDFLVWRDGEVYQRVNGHSFLDTDVAPGVSHEYYVTYNVLMGGAANADYLNSLEGLQPRTRAVSIGPQDSSDPVNPEGPVTPGDSNKRPDVPANLSGIVYSKTALEIFWSRVNNMAVSRYDVYRNAEFVTSVQGPSWYDDNLESDNTYRYSVVAVSSSGIGSNASTTLELSTGSNAVLDNNRLVSPKGLRGSVYSSTAIELFWDRDSAQSESYIVQAYDVEIGRSKGNSLFISGLNPGVDYEFTVLHADPDTAAQALAARVTLSTPD